MRATEAEKEGEEEERVTFSKCVRLRLMRKKGQGVNSGKRKVGHSSGFILKKIRLGFEKTQLGFKKNTVLFEKNTVDLFLKCRLGFCKNAGWVNSENVGWINAGWVNV